MNSVLLYFFYLIYFVVKVELVAFYRVGKIPEDTVRHITLHSQQNWGGIRGEKTIVIQLKMT